MIISVFLLHNKQHGALSFSESKRHASYICTVGEPCICRFCNWPTNPSRFLRPDCCCWQLISLLNARADSWGEKLGLLKSVTKSCSFHVSQDFMFDLFISERAGEPFLEQGTWRQSASGHTEGVRVSGCCSTALP